jgi:hypothetical protein
MVRKLSLTTGVFAENNSSSKLVDFGTLGLVENISSSFFFVSLGFEKMSSDFVTDFDLDFDEKISSSCQRHHQVCQHHHQVCQRHHQVCQLHHQFPQKMTEYHNRPLTSLEMKIKQKKKTEKKCKNL